MSSLEFDDRGRLYRLREVGGHHRLEIQQRPDLWEPVPAVEGLQIIARGVQGLYRELEQARRPRPFVPYGDLLIPLTPYAPRGGAVG